MKTIKDKEIGKEASERYANAFDGYKDAFIKGAKWYRKQMVHFMPGKKIL